MQERVKGLQTRQSSPPLESNHQAALEQPNGRTPTAEPCHIGRQVPGRSTEAVGNDIVSLAHRAFRDASGPGRSLEDRQPPSD